MALTKTLIKIWPSDNDIGIHLVLRDDDRPDLGAGERIVVKRTFRRNIPAGVEMSEKVEKELEKDAQAAIDNYKKLRANYETVYSDKVSKIDSNLKL